MNNTTIQTENPQIEILKTCSILMLPMAGRIIHDKAEIFLQLERMAISASFRKYTDGKFGRIFVLPNGWEISGLWKEIIDNFGEFKIVEKLC